METNETIQVIDQYMQYFAESLEPTVQIAWVTALQHNYAVATVDAIIAVLGFVAAILAYRWGKSFQWNDAQGLEIPAVAGVVAGCIVGIVTMCWAVLRFVAPSWHTAQDIMKLLGS